MSKKDDPAQLTFAVFAPAQFLRQTDGSLIVRPGKPLEELTPFQFGQHFRKDRETVYRWRQIGWIAEDFIRYIGAREFVISAKAIPELEKRFRGMHS